MLKTWIKYNTPECRNIITAVLSSHPKASSGVSTHEIYDLALKLFPDAKAPSPPQKYYPPDARGRRGKIPMPVAEPPNRDHPIRSLRFFLVLLIIHYPYFLYLYRYLKRVVLEDMVLRKEVEKVHIKRGVLNEDGERLDSI